MASQDFLNKAYLAYFGRPVDPVGAYAFKDSTEIEVYEAFFASPESQRLYGAEFGAEQINSIYQMHFGRDAEPAGLAHWLGMVETGRLTPAGAALAILQGAQGSDKVIIDNKLAASAKFTAALDTLVEADAYVGDAAAQYAREFLQSVGSQPKTQVQVDAAVATLVEIAEAGVIGKPNLFTLTENAIITEAVLADFEPTVKYVTYIGFNPHAHGETGVDNLDGNNPDGNDNNLTNETIPDGGVPLYDLDQYFNPVTYDNAGNPVFQTNFGQDHYVAQKGFFSYIRDLTGLDFVQLGLIDIANGANDEAQQLADSDQINIVINDDGTAVITVEADDGSIHTAEVDINNAYFKLLTNLVFDEESNLRLYEEQYLTYPTITVTKDANGNLLDEPYQVNVYQYVSEAGTKTIVPIVLTKYNNNGGTVEKGVNGQPYVTTTANDLIVAGRLELLHQAYIDAGEGVNTLEVDAKGYYAQPKALTNVQHIIVNNLPNVYNDASGGSTYPDLSGSSDYKNSVLDLNRAIDIETLTITESHFDGLGTNQTTPGSLTVSGIRNGAETTLDGSFTQNVYLHFGELQGTGVDLVLNNVNFGGMGGYQTPAQLVVAHNSPTLNIESTGGHNFIANGNLGAVNGYGAGSGDGALTNLNISGDAKLHIDGDLAASFHNNTPATIDARANTAGVDLQLTHDDEIVFYGTAAADDHFEAFSDRSITIAAGNGNGEFRAIADGDIVITAGNGNNEIYADSEGGDGDGIELEDTVTITVGNGQNDIQVLSEDAFAITAGDGNNRIKAALETVYEFGVTERDASVINVGNGQNEIDASASVLVINAGNGGNDIDATGLAVTVNSGSGNDTIRVVDARSITINSTGADTITIGGSSQDFAPGNDGSQLSLTLGNGATVILGEYATPSNQAGETITAHPGSFITGTNLTLFIDTVVDLRAATLSGISRVVLDDDNLGFTNSPEANDTGNVDRALLTLTDTQVSQMAADGVQFSVQGGIFNTSAHIKIIVTQNLDVTTGAWATWLSSLPASIDLQFEIADGKQLTLTAEQLHTKVAQGGIMIADDGRTDQVAGKVYIKGAGLNFDPFNASDKIRTTIEGREYVGGSLATGEFGFATDADTPADGIQRDEWGTNVKLDRTLTGYDRPAETPSYSRLTINTDEQGGEIGPFATIETFLRIIGEADMEFTPVKGAIDEWGAPITSGSAIAMGVDLGEPANTFMVDFSSATGAITNLTLAHFQNADAMYGNGSASAPARVNVEIGGDLDNAAGTLNDGRVGTSTAGLVSRGVQTYVVTDIDTDDDQAQFWTSRVTEDLQTLGLRGNYDKTITFGNTDRGVDFLLEVAYDKFDGYAVGNLVANFSRPEGATAVVNVVGLATLPANEVQKVASIVTDGNGLTINIEGGNTVIGSIGGANLDDVVLSTADNLAISTAMPLAGLESIDASAVEGNLSLTLSGAADGAGFEFTAAAGTTTLALSGVTAGAHSSFTAEDAATFNLVVTGSTDLSAATLENVDSIGLGAFGNVSGTVSLSAAQVADIGAANIGPAHPGFTATVNVSGVGSGTFDSTAFIDGTTVNVTLASGAVVLATDTDLSNVNTFEVLANSEVTMSADQLVQLAASLAAAGDINGFIADLATSKVNITGITQAHVDATFMLGAQEFSFTEMLEALSDRVESGTLTLAESVNLGASGSLNGFGFVLGDGMTLGVATAAQADGLVVEGGANTTINLLFSALAGDIDASGFNVDVLRFLDSLVVGQNVDDIFDGLLARVEKVIYNNYVSVIDQTVTISAGAVVNGNLSFDRTEDGLELQNFVLNLQGGTRIGGVDLGAAAPTGDLVQTYLKTVTINSTGTMANPVTGETGNIMGSLTGGTGVTENDLLSVTVNASQDLAMTGVVFTNVGTADEVATLTVTGEANVSVADLNTQDDDVDGLNVVHNGTGTLNVGIAAANIDGTDVLSFTGTGDIVLTVTGTVDLSDDNLAAVTELVLANGAVVTLTMAQGDAIGAGNISSPGAANLNLEGLAGEPFAVANYGAGVTVNLVSLAALPVVTLNAATDLTGINGLVVPEGTVLNLTAAQFKQLTLGTITGVDADGNASTEFTVNITDLTQADVDSGFNLSGISADNLTVTLAGDVALNSAETNNLNGADITIGANTFTLYSVALADALNITGTGILKFTDISAQLADQIDASGFDVSELHMEAGLIAGHNVDLLFQGLAASVTKVVTDEYGYVIGTNQTVVIQAGSTVSGDVAFIKQEGGEVEIRNFTLNLEGGVNMGGVNLSKDADTVDIPLHLQSVTINSTGTAANVLNGETANIINGDLTAAALSDVDPLTVAAEPTLENNLLSVTINASQALEITGSVVFNSVTLDDGVTANDIDDAVATLTVTGTADVTLGGINTIDADVDGANIVNNGTGTLSLTVDAAEIQAADALAFTGTGDIALTVVGAVNLSDDNLAAVSQITVAEDADLTLSFAQVSALGAANILSGDTDDTVDEALDIVGYDGSAFDFSALSDELVVNITMAAGNITLDPSVDLSGVESITVPEGGTLTLTAAQFQQLTGNGVINGIEPDGDPTGNFTVNITGLTQAIVDADFTAPAGTAEAGDGFKLGSVAANTITVSTAEDVDFDANVALNGASLSIGGFTLGLALESQADGLVVTGTAGSTVNFLFDAITGIDAAGYDISTLRAIAVSLAGQDVELLIDNLSSSVELNLYETAEQVGFVSPINRVVNIEDGVRVPGNLTFNGQDDDREMRTLTINFEGDANDGRTVLEDQDGLLEGAIIGGDLILDREPNDVNLNPLKFQKLTLNSLGAGDSNGIEGDIDPRDSDAGGNNVDNNLLNIEINATSDFTIGGTVFFSSTDADDATAILAVNGAGDVGIGALNVADTDVDALVINTTGTGTLTVAGASPSIQGPVESITLTGSANIVLGTAESVEDFADGIDGATELTSVNASALTGDLSIENITAVNAADFSFVSGTGVTTVRISDATLNDDDAPTAEPGWSFDLSDAAAGSQLVFGTGLVWTDGDLAVDLGANAQLIITANTNWTALDSVSVNGTIVLNDGVTLTLTAAQANGLNIVAGPDTGGAGFTGQVVITDLGDYTDLNSNGNNDDAAELVDYDFSGILVTASATLADDDVTISAGSDLGTVSITLDSMADTRALNLDGQTIRFSTEAQAARTINVNETANGGANNNDSSTNVVWLFNSITGPIETSGYDQAIGRIWFSEDLVNSEGGDVEGMFTTLPTQILRVDFTDLTALNALLASNPVNRVLELVSFTNLNDLTFSDIGLTPEEHIEDLTISMGGSVTVGDIQLDDVVNPGGDPDSVDFNFLQINSRAALHQNDLLAPELYVNNNNGVVQAGEHQQPANLNTIGDIFVGASNGIDLLDVRVNTFGLYDDGVAGGADLNDGANAVNVSGANLVLGTVTFDSEVAGSTALFTVAGQNNVTLKSLNTTDADITTLTVDTTGHTGTYTVTGGSPAAALGDVETFNIQTAVGGTSITFTPELVHTGNETVTVNYVLNGVAGSVVISSVEVADFTNGATIATAMAAALNAIDGIAAGAVGAAVNVFAEGGSTFSISSVTTGGTTDDLEGVVAGSGWGAAYFGTAQDNVNGVPYAGVAGDELSELNVTGDGYVNLGTIALIDGTDDDLNSDGDLLDAGENIAFTLNGNGSTVARLGAANVNGVVTAPTLAAESTWRFDGVELTITDDVTFVPGATPAEDPTLELEDVALTIEGDVDLTRVILDLTNVNVYVPAGESLTLTLDQVAALGATVIEGEGTVHITGEVDTASGNAADYTVVLTNIRTVGIDLSALTNAEAAPQTANVVVTANALGALDDNGDATGFNLEGTAFNDTITASAEDDTIDGGAGDDTLTGGDGNDTFNVTEGTDTITDLTGEADDGNALTDEENDVLVVSVGATAVATAIDEFVATAATTNAGTASITADDLDGDFETLVDMTAAGGTVGYTLTGDSTDGVANTLIGSGFADTINGGDSAQNSADDVDVLTGGAGADVFVFNVTTSTPATGAQLTPALQQGVDQELIQITAEAALVDDTDDEGLVVAYTVNGTNAALVIDLAGADVSDEESIANAVVAAFGSVSGVTATAVDNGGGDWDVLVEGNDGNKVSLNATTATTTGVALNGLAFAAVDGTDVQHQEELTISGVSAAAGEIYKATVTLADGTVIVGSYITSAAGETAAQIAQGIADDALTGFNTIAPAATVLATDVGAVITFTDEEDNDGAFTLVFSAEGGIAGTGASDLAATYAMADIVVDFVSGTDDISFGDDAGTVGNYEESATVAANYASALASAATNFDGSVKYYFTWIEATAPEAVPGLIAAGDDVGLLFFDLNGDKQVDGVVRLVGIDSTEFTHTDIIG